MRFKIDENLPVEVAALLVEAGHDALTVNEQNLQGAADSEIIQVCKNEHRVLVTLDMDFSDIRTYPPNSFSGIVVLRIAQQSKMHIMDVFSKALPLMGVEPLEGHLWIVEENRVRVHGRDEKIESAE